MAVIGYDFYIDGVKNNSAPAPANYTFSGLASNTEYDITAVAIDGAGNRSAPSAVLTASTSVIPPPPSESPLSAPDMAAVDAFITPLLYPNQTTPGVIISITGPRGYYKKAYGYNAPGVSGGIDGRPLTTDDHFRMGSITKTFTAMAFWQAVDDGLVHLSDTLETYVPGVPNGTTLTLEQIITMRSGVYEYTSNLGVLLNILLNPAGPYSQAQALALIKGNASTFAPGSKYTYENSNAILIRAVVEAVRPGRTFPDILQQDVFDPLGLTETKWPTDPNIPAPAMSTGQFNPELAGAAGALTSTIGDLTKWAKAMRDGALLSPATWNLWTGTFPSTVANPGTKPPNNFRYGHFLASFGSWMGHDGSVANYGSACVFDTVSGATVSVVTNLATSDAFYKIFRNIAALLYPSSVLDSNYTAKTVQPASATIHVTGGTPTVRQVAVGGVTPAGATLSITGGTPTVAVSNNKIAAPTGAALTVTGGTPVVNVTPVGALTPAAATISITGGTPTAAVSDNKTLTPTRVLLTITGGQPTVVAPVTPAGATLSITGGTPIVTVATAFTPFSIENTDVAAGTAVPAGATEWRFDGLGAGAGGGGGRSGATSTTRRGGPGGGGGALINTGWQSVSLLGPTYSMTRGVGGSGGTTPTFSGNGTNGANGGASTFVSGSVNMSAGGGQGATGATSSANGVVGAGGTASISGATATTANGTAGGQYSTTTPNSTAGAGAGGGAGGGWNSSNITITAKAGGDSTAAAGGVAANGTTSPAGDGSDQAAGDPGPGGGGGSRNASPYGDGGDGGNYGGGGGGSGGVTAGAGAVAGVGGDGYTKIEWR